MVSLFYGIFRVIFHTSWRNSIKERKAWKHGKHSKSKHAKHKECGFPVLWSLPDHFPYFLQINNKA